MIIPLDLKHRLEIQRIGDEAKTAERFVEMMPPELELLVAPYIGHNCTMFALGTNDRSFLEISSLRRFYEMFIELEDHKKKEGDFVIYTARNGKFEHLGRYDGDGKVVSKWGDLVPVLRHPVDWVPPKYGEVVRFLRMRPAS